MLAAKGAKKQEEQRKHLQAFVDRFRAKATKARQAQSRLKMLEKMEPVAAIVDDERAADPSALARKAAVAADHRAGTRVSVGYGERVVLSRLILLALERRPHRPARRQRQRQIDLRQAARRPAGDDGRQDGARAPSSRRASSRSIRSTISTSRTRPTSSLRG